MQYRFSTLASLADYLGNRATMFRESAAGITGDSYKQKEKRALLIERAATHENIADMIRHTVIEKGDTDVTIHLNPPQREDDHGL